jgi:hypothetical protein
MTTHDDTLARHRLPWPVRAVNRAGALLSRGRLSMVDLSEAALLAAARRTSGQPAGDAGAFSGALRALLASIEADARLSLLGRVAMRSQLTRNLANAMQIDAAIARAPGILASAVPRPLFILGFPRTGTTLLQRLLALVPGARAPRMWEVLWPLPPASPDDVHDERVARAERAVDGLLYLAPHIRAIHPFDPRGPEECLHLLENAFSCASYGYYLHVPGYLAWLSRTDARGAYGRYKAQLQLMQERAPARRWVLKWPGHMLELDALFAAFPDACVVQTHRDLSAVAASSCSYSGTLKTIFTEHVDLQAMGAEWLHDARHLVERALDARTRLDPARLFDLRYSDLIADPIGAVRRICERFDLPLPQAAEATMREHLGSNHASRHGVHRYSLAKFGLSEETIAREFVDYHRQFAVG